MDRPDRTWHRLPTGECERELAVDAARGLSAGEAAERLERHGPNALAEEARSSPLAVFLRQFRDFLVLVLIAAALVSGVVGEPKDSIAIAVIVVLNAVIGAVQEFRAERAVAALRSMAAPSARVRRDGRPVRVPADEVVPGDVVLLEAGDVVPADLRLVEVVELHVAEAVLTGESQPVAKDPAALERDELPLGDRANLAFKGTQVTRGRAAGVVVATGMATELGRIAGMLRAERRVDTPLQRRLRVFGRRLTYGILALCAALFALGLLRGEPAGLMFLTAVSLAVAAIPEALPAVVTIGLALGARKLSRRNALIRRLPAVETLGSVTFVCADKTGTLTENRMRAERLVVAGETRDALPDAGGAAEPWRSLGLALALNSEARAEEDGELVGDPTELALAEAARDAGFDREALERDLPRRAEHAFDSDRKRMTTVHEDGGRAVALTKGAPEVVLERCARELAGDGERALDAGAWRDRAEELAAEGYRVLAVARRDLDGGVDPARAEAVEADLTLVGLVALIDPPRAAAPDAVRECRRAGIVPVMITGDHPGTARAIARQLGILDGDDGAVRTGAELAELGPEELEREAPRTRVYARVSPEQKIRIVEALQRRGEFVAMTGDGVNDAPALKRAEIGVAMGGRGTDVAREAADMVLLDDDFATIVAAVREGRRIFDNIRKFVKYTMTSNAGEIWTLTLAAVLGLPLPLLPIHILWINLATDGLPGLALSAEPAERGLMRRPPRPPNESLFAHGLWQHMLWVGLLIGGLSLFGPTLLLGADEARWQTLVFTVLTLTQLAHALAIRSERESLFTQGLLSNRPLLGAVLLTLALQAAVVYVPFLQPIFKTQALGPESAALCLALPLTVLLAVELEKLLVRRGWIYRERAA